MAIKRREIWRDEDERARLMPRPQGGGKAPIGTTVRAVNKVPGTIQATAPRFTKGGGASGIKKAIDRDIRSVAPSAQSAQHFQSAHAQWRYEEEDTRVSLGGPCPTFGEEDRGDDWLNEVGFCVNGRLNNNLDQIQENIFRMYGISFAGGDIIPRVDQEGRLNGFIVNDHWSMGELMAVGQALWLVEQALTTGGASISREDMRSLFVGSTFHQGSDYNLIAALALGNNGIAVVPPPGLGGSGTAAYFREEWETTYTPLVETVIHELGHILDFKLGASFRAETLLNPNNPSTGMLIATNGTYNASLVEPYCQNAGTWGVCVGARAGNSGFVPGGMPPLYGSSRPPDHFEDFAESWAQWILGQTASLHGFSYETLDNARDQFFAQNIDTWFGSGS